MTPASHRLKYFTARFWHVLNKPMVFSDSLLLSMLLMLLHCRCGDVFIGQCIPFLLVLAKAQPAVATAALEQSGAVQELFGSNLKLGLPSAQQAAKQLLVHLYAQVRLQAASYAFACNPVFITLVFFASKQM